MVKKHEARKRGDSWNLANLAKFKQMDLLHPIEFEKRTNATSECLENEQNEA